VGSEITNSSEDVLQMPDSQIDEVLTKLDLSLKKLKNSTDEGHRAVHDAESLGLQRHFAMDLKPDASEDEKAAASQVLADLYCAIRVTDETGVAQRDLKAYFLNLYLEGTLLATVVTSVQRRIDTRVKRAEEDPNLTTEQRQAVYTSANLLRLSIDRGYPGGIANFGQELVSLTDPLINDSK